jgi:hypothetical protein
VSVICLLRIVVGLAGLGGRPRSLDGRADGQRRLGHGDRHRGRGAEEQEEDDAEGQEAHNGAVDDPARGPGLRRRRRAHRRRRGRSGRCADHAGGGGRRERGPRPGPGRHRPIRVVGDVGEGGPLAPRPGWRPGGRRREEGGTRLRGRQDVLGRSRWPGRDDRCAPGPGPGSRDGSGHVRAAPGGTEPAADGAAGSPAPAAAAGEIGSGHVLERRRCGHPRRTRRHRRHRRPLGQERRLSTGRRPPGTEAGTGRLDRYPTLERGHGAVGDESGALGDLLDTGVRAHDRRAQAALHGDAAQQADVERCLEGLGAGRHRQRDLIAAIGSLQLPGQIRDVVVLADVDQSPGHSAGLITPSSPS